MSLRLWIGIITFVAGGTLWRVASRERTVVPPWLGRLAAGVTSLGLGTLATTQPGLAWSVASIAFSATAIALIVSVLVSILRR